MAILVVGAAFSSSSCGGDGVHWAAFHEALNNVDSAASLCGEYWTTIEGSRCSIFILDFSQDPNSRNTERADASRQPHPDDSQNHNLTPDGRDETEQPERGQLN